MWLAIASRCSTAPHPDDSSILYDHPPRRAVEPIRDIGTSALVAVVGNSHTRETIGWEFENMRQRVIAKRFAQCLHASRNRNVHIDHGEPLLAIVSRNQRGKALAHRVHGLLVRRGNGGVARRRPAALDGGTASTPGRERLCGARACTDRQDPHGKGIHDLSRLGRCPDGWGIASSSPWFGLQRKDAETRRPLSTFSRGGPKRLRGACGRSCR